MVTPDMIEQETEFIYNKSTSLGKGKYTFKKYILCYHKHKTFMNHFIIFWKLYNS